MKTPLTLLRAETRPYMKDGIQKKWSSAIAVIEGEVIEINATEEMVERINDTLAKEGKSKEVEAEIALRQFSNGGKKTISVTLKGYK